MDMPRGRDLVPPRQRRGRGARLRLVLGAVLLVAVGVVVAAVLLRDGEPEPSPVACPTSLPARAALPEPPSVAVEVYNTTGAIGLAGRTRDELVARGFVVTKVDNLPGTVPDGPPLPRTEVHVQPGLRPAGELLALHLPDATVVEDPGLAVPVDARLGDGFTGLVPPEQAASAVTRRAADLRDQALAAVPAPCRAGLRDAPVPADGQAASR